jgi:hypothetical protein
VADGVVASADLQDGVFSPAGLMSRPSFLPFQSQVRPSLSLRSSVKLVPAPPAPPAPRAPLAAVDANVLALGAEIKGLEGRKAGLERENARLRRALKTQSAAITVLARGLRDGV